MIVIKLEIALAKENSRRASKGILKLSAQDLAEKIGIVPENLSRLRNGHFKAIRRSTLSALCRELNCQPGDLLEYVPGNDEEDDNNNI